jgi:hypothetical protein
MPFLPLSFCVVIKSEKAGKIFQIGYIEELLSFSMDVKTDFVLPAFCGKEKYFEKFHSDCELRQSEIVSDPQMGTFYTFTFAHRPGSLGLVLYVIRCVSLLKIDRSTPN